ncbi:MULTISPECIES: peptidoglycan-binding protein [Methylobacterium]|uniref:peptidoglycan-binding protein n=1 Tax=Methylobacterium TaxID=407 RepID=UPI0013EC9BC6|nr:peptidoglycan-binding protein [Methylobacterium sp. DB0501]NGM33250.1 peptidoglycan-binding protein [Methylobacterium sp. DB0501]
MSEAPARKPDEAAGRRSDGASPRRIDPDVALTAEARPAPRPGPAGGRAAPRAPRVPRAAAAARPASTGPLDRLRIRADRLMRHPAGIVGGLLTLGAVAAVAANALSFQTGRHPAPLFAKASTDTAPTDKAPRDKGSADRNVADKGASPAESPAQASARADAPRAMKPDAPRAMKPDAPRDGIGALLGGDDHATASLGPKSGPARAAAGKPARETAPHAPVREAKVAETAAPKSPEKTPEPKVTALHAVPPAPGVKPDKSIAYAQRALVKLGYGPLTVDGIAGPSTRAALARFERERRLPGASVARRTLQELEARSGLKPE